MKSIRTIIAAFFAALLLGAGIASAFSVDLTFPNAAGMPVMTYATVNGSLTDVHTFHFNINLAPGLSNDLGGGGNFGMDHFAFNTDLLGQISISNLDPTMWTIQLNKNMDGFGTYDIRMLHGQQGQPRPPRTDYLYFDVLAPNVNLTENNFFILSDSPADNGQGHFAAHIGGFNNYVPGSTFVRDEENPIPEPGTMILLGISLLTAAGFMRKMQK